VGHWTTPWPFAEDDAGLALGACGPEVETARALLAAYGYKVDLTGPFDPDLRTVLRAFQLHFRPASTDGRLDRSTLQTLARIQLPRRPADDRIA